MVCTMSTSWSSARSTRFARPGSFKRFECCVEILGGDGGSTGRLDLAALPPEPSLHNSTVFPLVES